MKAVLFSVVLCFGLQAAGPAIQVYKTRTCGCCAKWVSHLKENGFSPVVTDVPSTAAYREKYGIPGELSSCHTAVVEGYSIEGHVPASDIKRLLRQKPRARGLAVPGMPIGSPGMEGPGRQAYEVLLVKQDGSAAVFQKHPGD